MAGIEYFTVPHLTRKQLERVFSKIQIDKASGCWLWTGAIHGKGYGVTTYKAKFTLAHRLMYAWLVAPLQRGKGNGVPELDHVVCRNRRCCNPSHLELVSAKVNVLRGIGITAQHARKTLCKRGHELLPNPYGTGRRCPICASFTAMRSYHRRKRERAMQQSHTGS